MKCRLYELILMVMLGCMISCSGGGEDSPEPPPEPTPEVIPSEITLDSDIITNGLSFSEQEGEKSVRFTTNENWTLSVAATSGGSTWCTASQTSGSKGTISVKIKVKANDGYDNRSASVTIKAGTASKTFTVTQKQVDAILLTSNTYEIDQQGRTIEVKVKSNIDYQIEIPESSQSWIKQNESRSLTERTHTFTIAANEMETNREGEILFKSGDKVETVKILQLGGPYLLLSESNYVVGDSGETITVTLQSNCEYGVIMPEVDWILDNASSRGATTHSFIYTILPNEEYDSRTAQIIYYDKNSTLTDTLTITQLQKDAILVSSQTFDVTAEENTIELEVSTNINYTVSIHDSWVTQVSSPASRAMKTDKLYFKVAANIVTEARETSIVITDVAQKLTTVIKIKQAAYYTENSEKPNGNVNDMPWGN